MSGTSYELTRCPVCDSPDAIEIADREAIQSEVELLWAFHERRLRIGIPPARLTDRLAFSQDPPLRLSQCQRCSLVYRNPRERREALQTVYDDPELSDSVLQGMLDTQRQTYRAQIQRLTTVIGSTGRGLEVGSYAGGFLAAARDAGWTFEGVDVNRSAARFAARNGLKVTHGEMDDVMTESPFDAVAMWNTFEQLYDTHAAVIAARRRLRQGGMLVVRIPNGEFYITWRKRIQGSLSGVAMRVLAHNNLLSFPYRHGFTQRSLTTLLENHGFAIVHVFGDTLVPIADQWTTTYGTIEERVVKRLQRLSQHGWHAPWVEVYAQLA